MRPDSETIERLKAEHGEIYAVEVEDIVLVVRPPSKEAFRKFVRLADTTRYEAMEKLLQDCVVWPALNELEALLRRKPGIVAPVTEQLIKLAGAAQEATFRPL